MASFQDFQGITVEKLLELNCHKEFIEPPTQLDYYINNNASPEILKYVVITGKSFGEKYMERLNSDEDLTDDVSEIEQIIARQNIYCEHQASNKRTMGALTANIGEEKARYFMTEVLFPKIKTDNLS